MGKENQNRELYRGNLVLGLYSMSWVGRGRGRSRGSIDCVVVMVLQAPLLDLHQFSGFHAKFSSVILVTINFLHNSIIILHKM